MLSFKNFNFNYLGQRNFNNQIEKIKLEIITVLLF